MQAVTTIGLDTAKSVFQVRGVDAHGNVLVRRQLKRRHVLGFFAKLQGIPPLAQGDVAPCSNRSPPIGSNGASAVRDGCDWARYRRSNTVISGALYAHFGAAAFGMMASLCALGMLSALRVRDQQRG